MSPDVSGCTMPCRTNACIGHSIWSMQTANNGIITHRHLFRLKIYGFSFSVGMRVYFSKTIEKSKSHFSCVQSACMRECELIRCWVVVLSLIISIQHMSISEIGNFARCTQLITLCITQWPHRRTRKSIGKTGRFECIFLFFLSFACDFYRRFPFELTFPKPFDSICFWWFSKNAKHHTAARQQQQQPHGHTHRRVNKSNFSKSTNQTTWI